MDFVIKLLVEIVIGGLCGFAASKLLKVGNKSILFYIIVGVIGGAVGGALGSLIPVGSGWVFGVILAIVGSCLVVWLYKKLFKK